MKISCHRVWAGQRHDHSIALKIFLFPVKNQFLIMTFKVKGQDLKENGGQIKLIKTKYFTTFWTKLVDFNIYIHTISYGEQHWTMHFKVRDQDHSANAFKL